LFGEFDEFDEFEDDDASLAWEKELKEGEDRRDAFKRSVTPSQLEKGEVMAREIFERIEKRKAAEGE